MPIRRENKDRYPQDWGGDQQGNPRACVPAVRSMQRGELQAAPCHWQQGGPHCCPPGSPARELRSGEPPGVVPEVPQQIRRADAPCWHQGTGS